MTAENAAVPDTAPQGSLTREEQKSVTHGDFWIPEEEREKYKRALDALNREGIPYVVSGAYAIYEHTGIYRETKDLDLFLDPQHIAEAARVLRAYVYLGDPGVLVEDVAAKLGYGSPRILVRHARETTAVIPSALRRRVAPDELVAMLERRLLVATSDSACEA